MALGANPNDNASRTTPIQDARLGWVMVRTQQTSNESALVDLNDKPADAIAVPVDRRFMLLRGLAESTSTAFTVDLYAWPVDPGTGTAATQNDGDGEAAGWLVGTYTLTSTAKTADLISNVATVDQYITNIEAIDLQGAAYVATRTTNVSGDKLETVARFY